jgi:hypothetical protein
MIKLAALFKRLLLLVIMLFLITFSKNLLAQNIDFKYKIDSVKTEKETQFHITVTIIKGSAPFLVRLFEDFGKAHFEKVDAKENIQTKEVQFIISKKGKYIIVIDDNDKNSLLKRLNLANNQSL